MKPPFDSPKLFPRLPNNDIDLPSCTDEELEMLRLVFVHEMRHMLHHDLKDQDKFAALSASINEVRDERIRRAVTAPTNP